MRSESRVEAFPSPGSDVQRNGTAGDRRERRDRKLVHRGPGAQERSSSRSRPGLGPSSHKADAAEGLGGGTEWSRRIGRRCLRAAGALGWRG